MGLTEFGRATGQSQVLEQSRLFLERRGRATLSDVPFGRALLPGRHAHPGRRCVAGHAVRALYLAAAAVDVAVERRCAAAGRGRAAVGSIGGPAYLHRPAVWVPGTRTRGSATTGSSPRTGPTARPAPASHPSWCPGGCTWPPATAVPDLIERTLYNVIADLAAGRRAGVLLRQPAAAAGRRPAPDDDQVNPRAEGGTRAAWFDVSCCPTNVARTLASLNGYLATADDDGLQLCSTPRPGSTPPCRTAGTSP